jgi:hypothetical protein
MESNTLVVPWKPLHIIPVGDIQWAGKDHYSVAESALKEHIAKGKEYEDRGETVRYLGMGDYIDFLSPSNRTRLDAAALYDNALDILDKTALYLNDELFNVALKPTVGKWAGLVEGHHFKNLSTGATSDMMLCEKLRAKFLGTCGLVKFDFKTNGGNVVPFQIWAHHGLGNGQAGYYPLSRLEKVSAQWNGIHAFLMGHTCKQAMETQNQIYPTWPKGKLKLEHRKVYLVGTGGFSRSYVEGAKQGRVPRGHYSEKGMMAPVPLGSPIIHVVPRISAGYGWLEYTVEG